MNGDDAFEVDWLSKIEWLRRLLNDQYLTGLPIIKELLQNADDARATLLEIALVPGSTQDGDPTRHNPLFDGPALMVVNDGRFTDDNAVSIRQLGLSNKPGEQGAIGRFGLGLKSVFHLGEAFFYLSNDRSPRMLNPWSGSGEHDNWTRIDDQHHEHMRNQIARVISGDQWFCLWIPLRKQSHASSYGFIKRDFVLDECHDVVNSLFPASTAWDVCGILPMLQFVRQIRIWNLQQSSNPVLQISSSAGRRFNGIIERTEASHLRGTLSVSSDTHPAVTRTFSGVEHQVLLDERPTLSELFQDSHWPVNSGVRANRAYFQEKSKALAHGAAYFHAGPDTPAGTVRGTWAVFLPIESRIELDDKWFGNTDVNLTLHGYFFVDAGRRHVQFASDTNAIESEEALQRQWNRRLRDQIVLPLVIPALSQFVADNNYSFSEISQLTKAIQQSTFFQRQRSSICRSEQFVAAINRDGMKWRRISAQPLFALPSPPLSSPEVVWQIFPGLAGIKECIVAAGEPVLSRDSNYSDWPPELVRILVETPFARIIADAASLDYFVASWQFVTRGSGTSTSHRTLLRDVVRRMFAEVPFQYLLDSSETIKRLLNCLRPDDCVVVPTPNNSLPALGVLQSLYSLPLSSLPLPDSLIPTTFGPCGKLIPGDARIVLDALVRGPAGSTPGTNYFLWRSKAACCFFAQLTEDRGALRNEYENHRWFPTVRHTETEVKGKLSSIKECLDASAHGLLFVGTSRKNEWAFALQTALADRQVLIIDPQVAELLAPEYDSRQLTAEETVRTLGGRPPLAEPVKREALVSQFVNSCNESLLAKPEYRGAVRYLLHGHPEALDEDQDLLIEPDAAIEPVWSKLMEQLREASDATSRVVNPILASHINNSKRKVLGLSLIGRGSIPSEIRRLGAERVKCDSLSEDDVNVLLRQMDDSDDDVLRGMRIHRRADSPERIAIQENCYWTDGTFVVNDTRLLQQIHLLQLSNDPMTAARQRQLRPATWSPQAAIEVVAAQPTPSIHFSAVLDALYHSGDPDKSARYQQVSSLAWLPTQNGGSTSPREVIHWPEYGGRLDELLPKSCSVVPYSNLHATLQQDNRWKQISKEVLPSRIEALRMLGQAMAVQEAFRIGPISDNDFEVLEFSQAFRDAVQVMPVWKVVDRIPSNWTEQAAQFTRPLRTTIGAGRLVEILNYLANAAQAAEETSSKENARTVFSWYLRAAAGRPDFASDILPKLLLLNRRGRWKPASELCVGAFGIDGTNVIGDEHLSLVSGRVASNEFAQITNEDKIRADQAGDSPASADVVAQIDESAEKLVALCRRLEGAAPPAAIGGLLCMLGDHPRIVQVAQEYIGQVSPNTFRSKVDWKRGEHPRGPFSSIAEAISKHRYLFEVSSARSVPVLNLLGKDFDALVQMDFSHLLLGRISLVAGKGGLVRWTRRVRFRDVGPEQLQGRDCNQLLFETAARFLEDVFEQHDRSVMEDMWSDLLKTDQIDVRIAEEYILDSAFTYLATVMGSDVNDRLVEIWKRWDNARRQKVEADIAGQNRQTWLHDAELKARQARDDLRQLLTDDVDTQCEVLEAIRRKVNTQYQYTAASVLFELFQNADDAAVELGDLYTASEFVPNEARNIAIQVTSGALRVLHWGRPINKFMSSALNESRGRALGYDQDLEKMLMLARSDKSSRNGNRQRTGKFGLGFKSVFLVSDAPRVVSGRLAFAVIGGFLPKRLEDSDRQRMLRSCEDMQSEFAALASEGTLIELTLKQSAIDVRDVFHSFRRLVGYLLVFARQIKNCRLDVLDHPTEHIGWSPEKSFDNGMFEAGRISRSEESEVASENLFVIRGDSFAIVFGLGAFGFVSLSTDVPAIWVTAPTQEHLRIGFAINAPFDVDPGRASLVEVSSRNEQLAQAVGLELARQLALLHHKTTSESSWNELREALSLDVSCERYHFWDSLWEIGAAGFARRASLSGDVACDLVRRILWGGLESGLAQLYYEHRAVPSKLDVDEYSAVTTSSGITHLLTGCLDEECELLSLVARWNSFRGKLKPGRIVSQSRVWNVLRGLCTELCSVSPTPIELSTVLEWESELANTIDPEQAQRLGQVINGELIERLKVSQGHNRAEATRLQELLSVLAFRAHDGRYHPANQLLIGIDSDERPDEERMRAAFALDERVLSDEYTGDALRLFLVCRQQMNATVQDMVTWAVSADTEAKQQGVIGYLHHGMYGLQLAAHLRAHGLGDTWLADHPQFVAGATAAGSANPIFAAVTAILGSGNHTPPDDQEERDDEMPESDNAPTLDGSVLLPAIWEWWSVEGNTLVAEYEATLYPPDLKPQIVATDPGDDFAARKSWLVLLIRGMLETIGRARAEQHRGFIRLCDERLWLDQLVEMDRPSQAFLASVEAYINDQRHIINIEYFHWLRQFLGLATVACHLDVYSRAFLDIDRIEGAFALDHVLRPRTNPAYRGTDMDAPPIDPALGIGVCFVVRELVRNGVLYKNHHAHKYCFVPVKGVRDLFTRMGCEGLQNEPSEQWIVSKTIHEFILNHFGGDMEMASFEKAFDLPFYIISTRPDLQVQLLGAALPR